MLFATCKLNTSCYTWEFQLNILLKQIWDPEILKIQTMVRFKNLDSLLVKLIVIMNAFIDDKRNQLLQFVAADLQASIYNKTTTTK